MLSIKITLKSVAALKSLARQDPLEWPTVKLLLKRIKNEGVEKSYQGAILKNFTQEKSKEDALRDLTGLDEKMREHLAWSDTSLLRSLLAFLETQTWMKHSHSTSTDSLLSDDDDDAVEDCSLAEIKEAVENIATHFELPLEGRGVSIVALQDEIVE